MNSGIPLNGWKTRQGDGLPGLADFIVQDLDSETLVFRRFRALAARNCLHLQGELISLEDQLLKLEDEAAASEDVDTLMSMRSWSHHDKQRQTAGRAFEKRRQDLAETIDVKLKAYYETLMLHREIALLKRPSSRVMAALRQWMHGDEGVPNRTSKVNDGDSHMYDDEPDLVALRAPPDSDLLSRFLRNHWPLPSKRLSAHEWDKFRHFEERRLNWLVTSLSVALATSLLSLPILVLYFVKQPNARLALVICFILVFALGLSLSTSANRDAIFAATAAYSAVLVVFVSGDLANAK